MSEHRPLPPITRLPSVTNKRSPSPNPPAIHQYHTTRALFSAQLSSEPPLGGSRGRGETPTHPPSSRRGAYARLSTLFHNRPQPPLITSPISILLHNFPLLPTPGYFTPSNIIEGLPRDDGACSPVLRPGNRPILMELVLLYSGTPPVEDRQRWKRVQETQKREI